MQPAPGIQRQGGGSSTSSLMALLSLKLLLLAFFILLTVLAQFENEKVKKVVDSVNKTFEGRVEVNRTINPLPGADGIQQGGAPALSELSRLFRSYLPKASMEVDPALGELRLEMPANELFLRDSTQLNGRAERLIDRVAVELSRRQDWNADYDLELLNGFDPQAMERLLDSQGQSPVFLRAGALVRSFLDRDLAADRISGGLLPEKAGKVRIVVRLWGGEGEPDQPAELNP
ncbi:hypothetical protein [Fodinicurvata fenggangensis]|uniref:hypothetical protein n=1 Tax=Fodinicurvata fenggangensis TaxID=1121830 RepID=UPI0012DCC17B|nr:hypothetical protein [Fodinicurvata fenggangensis]